MMNYLLKKIKLWCCLFYVFLNTASHPAMFLLFPVFFTSDECITYQLHCFQIICMCTNHVPRQRLLPWNVLSELLTAANMAYLPNVTAEIQRRKPKALSIKRAVPGPKMHQNVNTPEKGQ
jgi:hypothetical protein